MKLRSKLAGPAKGAIGMAIAGLAVIVLERRWAFKS